MSSIKSTNSTSSSDSYSWLDDWPEDFDGTGLFERLRSGEPPVFRFSMKDVIDEVEKNLDSQVIGIPLVGHGSNFFVSDAA